MELGSVISKLLKERSWSLTRLAREAKVPHQTIHNWITGRTSVNPDQIKKVALALNVSVHYVLFGSSDPNENPSEEILKEIFSGDVRVTVHRIQKVKKNQ